MSFWKSVATAAKSATRCQVKPPSVLGTRAVLCFSTRSSAGIRGPQKSRQPCSNSPTLRYSRQARVVSTPWSIVPSDTTCSASTSVRDFSAEPVAYDDPIPASEVDPNAIEDEKKIKELAAAGEWEEARKLLKSIRDRNMKPSMEASVDVVSVLRRALLFQDAEECYMEMINEHIPDDIFTAFAASEPEDESKRVSARSLAIAVMMQEDPDNIVPKDEETYRGLLLNLQDDHCWQAALLLAEQAERDGIVLENFSVNVLCSMMGVQGYDDVAAMLYERLIVERLDMLSQDARQISELPWKPERLSKNNLDLHSLTASASVAAVRIALLDLVRKPTTRAVMNSEKTLRIVTGLGNNSEGGEAVIKPQVLRLLETLKIKHDFQLNNEGCIEIEPPATKDYIARITSKEGAALPAIP